MHKNIKNQAITQRKYKITGLFLVLILAMAIFLFSILNTITSKRDIPSHNTTIHDRSFRGSIVSADNYTLSNSQKTYQAVIHGASIVPKKKEVFIKLFSIYSGISEKKLYEKFKNRKEQEIKGNIILSKSINAKHAMQLKSLAYKLRKLGVFQSTKTRSGIEVIYGLDIIENGEKRRFPLKDVMSPILGYVGNKSDGHYTRPQGKKGLEKNYAKHITSKKNGYFKGKRDVVGTVIHDKNSIKMQRVDGLDLHLNIPLAFQRRVELMLDGMKKALDADEILVGVMESKTGKVLSLASSERYNPAHILQKDIAALNPKFSEYPYEAGSVIKPITLAIALDNKVVTPRSWFKTYDGRFQIGKKRWITDDEKFDSLDATDIIVHSSNIGISQISWRLTGKEFREGFLKFGIAKPSGIDLSRDLPGKLKPLYLLNHKLHRANSAYGYGMLVTFAQLFKAYSAFNNDGVAVTPRIVAYLQDKKGNHYTLDPKIGDLKAAGKRTAKQIHKILLEVVKRGTGEKAQYPGLEIGGKTGTAHIAEHGHYVKEYHSSFYGFANDKKGHKYTIGVLVVKAKRYQKYFAANSAVPTFRRIIDILVELNYLEPKGGIEVLSPEIPNISSTPSEPTLPAKIDVLEQEDKDISKQKKKRSIKSLFNIKRTQKPKVRTLKPIQEKKRPKTKPAPVKPKFDSSEDLF